MAKTPPIPRDQRTHASDRTKLKTKPQDRREETTDLQSSQPGDDDVNLRRQGRHGNIYQNTRNQGYQQDR